ncbi:squalene-hopene/tetraprenyl-beta-curcumene cyclase [Methylomagnum ishizawai]|uniref:Squalene-hopene/tetraprenyl-beta-curcumene cyclase n=1 Tax=Methylomagnum ishizawai TaxID=1760988 RepID=A0A1Y6D699_9GAMM|nr:squalene--hopene cyclase [Methylomagnum ishizawai]SMF96373.1 squalene-hopene/tetraprenyl-beta-curcumene cyclase [Methylomagnum ishizawai]
MFTEPAARNTAIDSAFLKPYETPLDQAIRRVKDHLLALQHEEGYWVFELEADCTIPSEYILMMHFMDELDADLQAKIAVYLRAHQQADGSYPLFTGGPGDMSCTVKVYYALKLAGDDIDAPHMKKAREWVLSQGGAAHSNVFTRIMLAMFEQVPWRAVPFIPVEIMLLPKWFPFHLDKVSYWSRTVMVPLFILCSHKVKARNPLKIGVRELFTVDPELERDYFSHVKTPLGKAILALERVGFRMEPLIPKALRRKATQKALEWFVERLNGVDGLGAIFPAMVNAYEALDLLGYPPEHEHRRIAKESIDRLLVFKEDHAYCQPCVSPIWDTGLSSLALQAANQYDRDTHTEAAVQAGLRWLASKQLTDHPGDWRIRKPDVEGGGWAFQFDNTYYPDVDDSAVVAQAILQGNDGEYTEVLRRAGNWIAGMASENGGWGAFDADNTYYYLNNIPFADHGALLDPPTADVSGRCVMFLASDKQRRAEFQPVIDAGIAYLRQEQEADGSWFGRWGTNYIYGTWSVLVGFEAAGVPKDDPAMRRAAAWLKSVQRPDGSWGEDNFTYHDPSADKRGRFEYSMAFHTALALLALMAAGEANAPEVAAGVDYLLRTQGEDGFWHDPYFNAPGFPKVFYLKYHGYDKFFPLWALARYRNERG